MKICGVCEKSFPALWKSKSRDHPAMCKACWTQYKASTSDDNDSAASKYPKRSSIAQKPRKPTGEWKLFMQIYSERGGRCEVTGKMVPLVPAAFAHILGKQAYPRYRLNPDNIILVDPDVHHYYDNSDKETLLKHYPAAGVIYERKEELKSKYNRE